MTIGVDPRTCIRGGNRLRCITQNGPRGVERQLTVGKEYEVLDDSYWSFDGHHLVRIKNDCGVDFHYSMSNFEVVVS